MSEAIIKRFEISKVSDELGIIFGYAIVCKENGEDYVDLQDEHVPESAMMKASAKYMAGERRAKLMHDKVAYDGRVIYALPMTTELADALGIQVKKTGLIIGLKPDNPDTLQLAKEGRLTGFSIGGRYVRTSTREVA